MLAQQRDFDVSQERRLFLLYEPYMLPFIHRQKHVYSEEPGLWAKTDGSTIWYGANYSTLATIQRTNVYIHELMHCVLKHVERAILKKLEMGYLFLPLWNWAADAVINEGIDANPATPSGSFAWPTDFTPIRMAAIHQIMAEAVEVSGANPPASYNAKAKNGQQVEIIYDWLVWALHAVREKRKKNSQATGQGGAAGDERGGNEGSPSDPSTPPRAINDNEASHSSGGGDGFPETAIERLAKQDAFDLVEQINGKMRDCEGKTRGQMIEEINKEIERAKAQIQQIVQGQKIRGDTKGSLLLELVNDLPRPVVPWNHKLRKMITQGLSVVPAVAYHRFGIQTIAGLANRHRKIPYAPGSTIYSDAPRVLAILDVSGSHLSAINQCLSEIMAICRLKNAIVDVITFDGGVQEKFTISSKRDLMDLIKRGIQGAGGTVMAGVFEEVDAMPVPYRSVIVMTDGYLVPPPKPKFDVTWMITQGGRADALTAYGEIINLPDYLPSAA